MNPDNPYQAPQADVETSAGDTQTQHVHPARRVRAGRGVAWFNESFVNVLRSTPGWFVFGLLFAVAYLPVLISSIALESSLRAAHMLALSTYYIPLAFLTGGAMYACHQGRFRIVNVWRGMTQAKGPLLVLGLWYAFLGLPGSYVSSSPLVIEADPVAYQTLFENDPGRAIAVVLAVLVYYTLFIMAAYFAPALVSVGGVSPAPALWRSFKAVMRNTLPFLLLGLVILGLGIALIFLFGIAMFIAISVAGIGVLSAPGLEQDPSMAIIGLIAIFLYVLFLIGVLAVGAQIQYAGFKDVFLDNADD
ncbi:MAG: hypothetical protein AAF610_13235 [Pseudomonadota bacterium]